MLIRSSTQIRTAKSSKKLLGHMRTQSTEMYGISKHAKEKKKKTSQKHKRTKSSNCFNLVPLVGQKVQKAPKIYNNQIFSDVYDERGNHDRVIELSSDFDRDFLYQQQFIVPDLLKLPTAGRNLYNKKKIRFF